MGWFALAAGIALLAFFALGIRHSLSGPVGEAPGEAEALESPYIKDVDELGFRQAVIESSQSAPVLVDFWADWCGPCRVLGPRLERAVHQRGGALLLAKVNSDQNPGLLHEYQVDSIPTVLAFHHGEVVAELRGAVPEGTLRQFIDDVIHGRTQEDAQV
jgi:putative thioredoxin